jgi:hypothetical protein
MSVSTKTFDASFDGLSAVVIAAYLFAVVYRGNLKPLGAAVLQDGPGFLEALVAMYIVVLLMNVGGWTGKIMTGLVMLAIVGIAVKVATGNASALQSYASGNVGLFGLIQKLATGG